MDGGRCERRRWSGNGLQFGNRAGNWNRNVTAAKHPVRETSATKSASPRAFGGSALPGEVFALSAADLITVMLDARHRGADGAGVTEILAAQLNDFPSRHFSNPDITVSDAARGRKAHPPIWSNATRDPGTVYTGRSLDSLILCIGISLFTVCTPFLRVRCRLWNCR